MKESAVDANNFAVPTTGFMLVATTGSTLAPQLDPKFRPAAKDFLGCCQLNYLVGVREKMRSDVAG